MKKSPAFYLVAVGTVFAVLALMFYLNSGITMKYVTILNVFAIVAGALYLVLPRVLGDKEWCIYLVSVAAVLILGAVGYSLIAEVEQLGYLVSGLRDWKDVALWAYFAIAGLIAWLALLVASFTKVNSKEV